MDDLVLRSAYLRLSDDMQLRKLAHELSVTKSDLIRAAIHVKLEDWRSANDLDVVLRDLAFRIGDGKVAETVKVTVPKVRPGGATKASPKAEKKSAARPVLSQPSKRAAVPAEDLAPV
ncbi:MAG: hypothetical protein J0M19_06105 [Sphingomonadales bacterium]|nr:hypothetical protein [Sphingomonadales bacterium]